MTVVPGIELSCSDPKRGRRAHLLGYAYRLPAPSLTAFCSPTLAARDALTRRQVGILAKAGWPVSIEEVEAEAGQGAALYKQHVMAVLLRKGAADALIGSVYRSLFKGGGPCDLEIDYPDVREALDAIHADGGLAVLAHPGQLDSWELLDELAEAGLDGAELYHEDHGLRERELVLAAKARYPWLLLTGGSDFHGAYGSKVAIGDIVAPADSIPILLGSRGAPPRPAQVR